MNDNTVNSILELDEHIRAYFLILFLELRN